MKLTPRTIDISSKRFGKLTVLEFAGLDKHNGSLWLCLCDCGGTKVVTKGALKSGATISCGCVQQQRLKEGREKHLMSNHPLFKTWEAMLRRCNNPKDKDFKSYGGRGITVCDRWLDVHSFISDMGERPKGYTLDRINVNGNYEPVNCRWASSKCQGGNKRNNVLVKVGDKLVVMAEAARLTGVPETTIKRKLENGTWDSETVKRNKNVVHTYNGESMTLKQWSEKLGIKHATLMYRIRKGIPLGKELK